MNESLNEALKYHFSKYKKMTPQDTVKLIFQSEFGGGHLIENEETALEFLKKELGAVKKDPNVPTLEYIGGSAYRINLANLPKGLSPETLCRIFAVSAEMFHGNISDYEKKLKLVLPFIKEGYTSFSQEEYGEFLSLYFQNGGGAVHHSAIYNSEYKAAYRVIHSDLVPHLNIFASIDSMSDEKKQDAIRSFSSDPVSAHLLALVYKR